MSVFTFESVLCQLQ